MPVPSKSLMKGFWKASYTYPTTKYTEEYTEKLFGEIERAWKAWQQGFKFGGLTVGGLGVGGWAGTGVGGKVIAQPFQGQVFIFYQQTKQQEKFQTTLYQTMKATLAELVAAISFTSVNYAGASTATSINPGVFTANIVPMTIAMATPKSSISGVGQRWKAQLTPPDFDLTHPQCAATAMVNAVASAVEKAFSLWATSTNVSGSTATGPATPGAGAGTGTSQFNGVLL